MLKIFFKILIGSLLLQVIRSTEPESINYFQDKILTPLEVNLYVDEFMKVAQSHEQLGFLTLRQLSEVFNYWKTMNDTLKLKSEYLKSGKGGNAHKPNRRYTRFRQFLIPISILEGYILYVAEFLLIMLDIKRPVSAILM